MKEIERSLPSKSKLLKKIQTKKKEPRKMNKIERKCKQNEIKCKKQIPWIICEKMQEFEQKWKTLKQNEQNAKK